MTTPVESLQDSIRRTLASMKRDAPAARFIGEQVVKMVGRSLTQKLKGASSNASKHLVKDDRVDEERLYRQADVASDAGDLPWPQYEVMSAREIISELQSSPEDMRVRVGNYERRHRARATVLAACGTEQAQSS